MVKFYYTLRSPYARKIRILLAETQIEHDAIEITPGEYDHGSLFGQAYEALVPSLRVPAIQHGDDLIFESNAIMTYLYQFEPKLNNQEIPLAPSVIRSKKVWLDTMILTSIDVLLDSGVNVIQVGRFGVDTTSHPYMQREVKRIQTCLDWLEEKATLDGFSPGVFSIADINLVCALQWFDARKSVKWRGRPNLESILAKFQERPSVKANPIVIT